jgi:hypothetical protein
MALGLSAEAAAKPKFKSYELKSKHDEILIFDLNGDGLDDIGVIAEPNLVFFLQDARKGFSGKSELVYSGFDRQSIIWTAKMGGLRGENLLVMDNRGVCSLGYVDTTQPLTKKNIIDRATLIPKKCRKNRVLNFKLSADTGMKYPVIFVPTRTGLEVWEYENGWHYAYTLWGRLEPSIWGPSKGMGYVEQYWLSMNVGDINGDGLEDLVICDSKKGKLIFDVYLRSLSGAFSLKPSQSFEDEWDWQTWISILDINRDGKADLIKNTWVDEEWFIPGTKSGKVYVRIFMSDEQGKLAGKPDKVYREDDWNSSMPIVDIDGDGFIDLVLGHSLVSGREDIRKSISAKKLDHNLWFYFYNNGDYPKKPDCQKALTVDIGHAGVHLTWSRREYLNKQISLDGDFNGDGSKDLLVKDRKDRASVYFFRSRKKGFSKKADLKFSKLKRVVDRFIIEDVNRDNISDVIVVDSDKGSFRVFVSQGK